MKHLHLQMACVLQRTLGRAAALLIFSALGDWCPEAIHHLCGLRWLVCTGIFRRLAVMVKAHLSSYGWCLAGIRINEEGMCSSELTREPKGFAFQCCDWNKLFGPDILLIIIIKISLLWLAGVSAGPTVRSHAGNNRIKIFVEFFCLRTPSLHVVSIRALFWVLQWLCF